MEKRKFEKVDVPVRQVETVARLIMVVEYQQLPDTSDLEDLIEAANNIGATSTAVLETFGAIRTVLR